MILTAAADISSVPAEFVKYFIMMVAFIAGLYIAHRKGKQANGSKDEPLNIEQPLEVKKAPRYAHKEEVEKVNLEVRRIIQAGDERQGKIIEAIGQSERRLLVEVKDLHIRLNPVAAASSAHAALLEQINHRLTNHEKLRQEESQRIHQRIDDAIRLSTSKK
ncbi:MAG: hypothetical protein K9N47_05605 [Prosthecobacter sp.]|uniref:hypothetical protein n=1 Tax=Prosthecobacter sp. TaxID=1965333 RepID=UPI0025F70DD9|nr:hypothetical protein [Prosthecobacter sp.]MCF7785576.1 hypothetical protein [Prosthecobacter sp.]